MADYTEHYHLHQWQPQDPFLRTDFNEDLQKIDTALDTLAADSAALEKELALRGNCQLWTTSYVGNGLVGANSNNRITFPKLPYLVIIQGTTGGETMLIVGQNKRYLTIMGTAFGGNITWEGTTMSWVVNMDNAYDQFNSDGVTYLVLALLPADQ